MSIDATITKPVLTKEEKEAKRARKEAKCAKKAAEAAASGAATPSLTVESGASTPAPAADAAAASESKEEKRRRKEEKKRKRAEQAEQGTGAGEKVDDVPEVQAERSSKKSKVDELSAAAAASAVPTAFNSSHDAYLTSQNVTLLPRTFPPVLSIPSLPVNPSILKWLSKFKSPTPIQACSWPALLSSRDVVAIAETGSGKTLGFGVPGLHLLSSISPAGDGVEGESKKDKKKKKKAAAAGHATSVQMLVIAPTRELALQSHETIVDLGAALGIKSVCLYGGVGKHEQLADLRRPDNRVVVGTPGRILDLADSGDLDLSGVKYLVLDEADRMLDQGFENDIRRIIAHTPSESRQTVMFSATWPESVRRLASTFLNNPVRITVGSDELSANKRIDQTVEVLDSSRDKDFRMLHHLRSFLKAHPSSPAAPTRILVFALYKKEAQRLESTIQRNRISVAGLHGDMGQDARFKALDSFKRGEVEVLVATDVAARGLDIPDVGLVVNVTFPLTTEDFVHRCGRTGRAGKSGKAVTFFTGENHERSLAGEFMRVLRDVGAEIPKEMDRFPSTIKKKEHGSYGAFYKDTTDAPAATKITFD